MRASWGRCPTISSAAPLSRVIRLWDHVRFHVAKVGQSEVGITGLLCEREFLRGVQAILAAHVAARNRFGSHASPDKRTASDVMTTLFRKTQKIEQALDWIANDEADVVGLLRDGELEGAIAAPQALAIAIERFPIEADAPVLEAAVPISHEISGEYGLERSIMETRILGQATIGVRHEGELCGVVSEIEILRAACRDQIRDSRYSHALESHETQVFQIAVDLPPLPTTASLAEVARWMLRRHCSAIRIQDGANEAPLMATDRRVLAAIIRGR